MAATVASPNVQAQTTGSTAPPPAAAPALAQPAPVSPAPVFLNHPTLADTAHLKSGDGTIALFGIKGWGGDPVQGLQSYLAENGDRVTCQPHAGGLYTCTLPTGVDLAEAALANGAAETTADAPAPYRQQEAAAQAGHLGIWAALPPIPVTVDQPVVQTTAEIVGDGRVFLLDGLIGFPAQFYTLQLQNYIAAHGNRLRCQQQPNSRYVCLLPDGTDIGAVALTNGLARLDTDATGQYRADQAKAVASKNGFWFNPPSEGGFTPIPVITQTPNCCVYPPGDLGEGIGYADGVPTAVIDNEPVFFGYAGLLGFGFYDLNRHWHAAPAPYLAHLARFHPEGVGLRSPATPAAVRPVTAFHAPGSIGPTPALPRVFNGPPSIADAVPFHAPGVFNGPGSTQSSAAIGLPLGTQRGMVQPRVMPPLGVGLSPGFSSLHTGISPIRPLEPPHLAAPRPFGQR